MKIEIDTIRVSTKYRIAPSEKDEYPIISVDCEGSVWGPDPELLADGWSFAGYDQYNAIFYHRKQMDIREDIEGIAIGCRGKYENDTEKKGLSCIDYGIGRFEFPIPDNLKEQIIKEVFCLYMQDIGKYKYFGEILSPELRSQLISIYSNQILDGMKKLYIEKNPKAKVLKELWISL